MANLAINENDARNLYTSAGESTFTYTFPVKTTDDIKVSVNQVDQVYATDFTFTGLGEAAGGVVTITAGTSAADVVCIWLDLPIKRETGFTEGAAVLTAQALNDELAERTRVDQMLDRDIQRSLRLAPDDPNGASDMELPTSTTRAGKFLAFNASGLPIATDSAGDADSTLRSDLASTDAGKGIELVAVPIHADETAAGITVVNSVYPLGHILRYGTNTTPGTTDMTTAIDACIALAKESDDRFWEIPAGVYAYTGTLQLGELNGVRGAGSECCYLVITPTAGNPHCVYAPGTTPWPTGGPSEQAPLADSSDRENWGRFGGFKIKGAASAAVAGEYGFQTGDDAATSASINGMVFYDIQVEQTGDSGLYLERATYGCTFDVNVHDCYGAGIEVLDKTTNKCNANTFIKPSTIRCKEGIVVGSSVGNTFHDAHIEALAGHTVATGHAIRVDTTQGAGHDVSGTQFLGNTYIEWNETTETEVVSIDNANYTTIEGYIGSLRTGSTNANNLTALIRDTTNAFRVTQRLRFNTDHAIANAVDSKAADCFRDNYYITPDNYTDAFVTPGTTKKFFERISNGGVFIGEYGTAPDIQYDGQLAIAKAPGFDGVSGAGVYRADRSKVTMTAATISFTTNNTISDSGSGLAVFSVGDEIAVTGSDDNDGVYTVATVAAGTITTTETTITTEAAAATITLFRPHWHFQGGDVPSVTNTNLGDATHASNLRGFKLAGKQVLNSTDGFLYFCEGDGPTDNWFKLGDRTVTITPA